jgi:poly(3-hydroxybutyrate) depolymerase
MLRKALCFAIVCVFTANTQTVNLQGTISNSGGKPVNGAIVSLVRQNMKDTTGTDGKFSFAGTSVNNLPAIVPHSSEVSFLNNVLQFDLNSSSSLKLEIFDLKGNLLWQQRNPNAAAGTYRFDLTKNCRATKVLIIKAGIGNSEAAFRYMPLNGGRSVVNQIDAASTFTNNGGLVAAAAVVDTLKVVATGFQTKSVPLISLNNQQQNVTLDSSSTNGKNPPAPSRGCGKALGGFNNDRANTIKVGSSNRSYRINVPSSYNKDNPYRLIFGMHCMYGDADKVAGTTDQSAQYYHIKTQAEKDNIQCIYVAPSGGGSNGTWLGAPDRTFFFELQKMLKDSLCIDTTRVFSVGFSFGAMFSYALSLQYPEILRAVACNAPANYSMEQPTNRHIPIAYVQTTGKGDPTCPWVSNEAQKTGGKFCLMQHAQDNGCSTTIEEVAIASSGKHLVTEFKGCKDGYPVKFCSHNGVHECNKIDQGSNVDWIPVEFWEFFKRF